MTISVAHDGSYKDDEGKQYYLSNVVTNVIKAMNINQKILIQREDNDEKGEKRGGKI